MSYDPSTRAKYCEAGIINALKSILTIKNNKKVTLKNYYMKDKSKNIE